MEENSLVQTTNEEALQSAEAPSAPENTESFATLDYVKEIFLNSVEQKKNDKKKIRIMRFCGLCMAAIAIALIVALVLVGTQLKPVFNNLQTITTEIAKIDVASITADAQKLMTETQTTVKSANQTLTALDMETLNETIKELGAKIDSMDMESLNSAIESLNEVVTRMSKFKLFG